MAEIICTKNSGIANIRLNRPESYNSVNAALALAFIEALDDCQQDSTIRVVVITGSGKAFCAGQDLKEVTDEDVMPGFKHLLEKHYTPIITKIVGLNKPVIAAVNGVAAGAGTNIALACDIIIASDKAKFIQAFSAIGLIPDSGGTYTLPRLVGRAKAMAFAMLGDKIDAQTAQQIGMIYQCVPAENFETTITQLAERLSTMPTKGLALTKQAINASFENTFSEQLSLEKQLQIEASETADYFEGVAAFLEKRKPNFKGL